MGNIILPNAVKREEGFIYYIDKEGNLCRSARAKGRIKSNKPKAVKKVTKKPAKKLVKKVVKRTTKK